MIAAALVALLAAPQVTKVEPPSWWPGHSHDPVRLLVRGRDLAGAVAEGAPGVRVMGTPRVSARGTYLFVDVSIDRQAPAGRRRLRLTTVGGTAEVPFEVLAPLPPEGRFQGFSPDDVVYLIMPDRFANGDPANDDPAVSRGMLDRGKKRYYHGGDLRGIIDHLPYLADLGVTGIWMTPLYDNVNHVNERQVVDGAPVTDYHGYGAVDFYAVDEHLGDLATLRELVDAAHRAGIKVIQDQVVNHTGPYHPWVEDPPTATWFNGTASRHRENRWQTWTLMDPHATPELRRETLEGWFANVLPDLNQDDPEAARYLIQNALWWVGVTGIDAIRQDTLPYVPRRFWRDWSAALEREFPRLTRLGEVFDGNPALVSFFQGGWEQDGMDIGIDTLFDFPLFHPIRRAFAQGQPLREVAAMLAHDHLYPDPSVLMTLLGLHDTPRFMNETGATVDGLKLAHAFLLTTRGTPLLYYGDEIALPGGADPHNRDDFPGGFPGDVRNAFSPAGRRPEEAEVFDHLRALARLRRDLEPLRRGKLVNLAVGEQAWAYARVTDGGAVLVVINNAAAPGVVEVATAPMRWREGTIVRDRLSGAVTARVSSGRIRLSIPPRAAVTMTPQDR